MRLNENRTIYRRWVIHTQQRAAAASPTIHSLKNSKEKYVYRWTQAKWTKIQRKMNREEKTNNEVEWYIFFLCLFSNLPHAAVYPGTHYVNEFLIADENSFVSSVLVCVICDAHRSVRFHHFTVHIPKKIAKQWIFTFCAHICCTEQKPEQQFSSYTWCIFPATKIKRCIFFILFLLLLSRECVLCHRRFSITWCNQGLSVNACWFVYSVQSISPRIIAKG